MGEILQIEILNWNKHQPRKDIKHPKWFAIDNRILEDSKLYGLKANQWQALLYIFCQASQQNTSTPSIDLAHAKRVCSISESSIKSLCRTVPYVIRTQPVRVCTQSVRDTTLQDTTPQDTAVVQNPPAPTEVRSAEDLIQVIPEKIRGGWPKLYPDPGYVDREAIKAAAWCEANQKKIPKSVRGWSQFFSGWLERGWEKHRKGLASAKPDTGGWRHIDGV